MAIDISIIDSFTSTKFKGNPTPVCIVDSFPEYETMHAIAKEFNLPVAAFISKQKENGAYPIKYFTITGEIPACGHATLAATKMLGESMPGETAVFKTVENILIGTAIRNDIIYLTYPKYQPVSSDAGMPVVKSLGSPAYQSMFLCKELETLFIELIDPGVLRAIKPDFDAIVKSSDTIIEVVLTSASDDPAYDFLLRSFCPWIGINEDPVTGSVHSILAHFWKNKLGKAKLKAYQASERGGEVYVNALEDKVELGGKALIIMKGVLDVS